MKLNQHALGYLDGDITICFAERRSLWHDQVFKCAILNLQVLF